jgi:threonine/homoserine/homoserine lactone efflux protein
VLEAFSWLRLAIHLFGAAYLVYFGARLIWRSWRSEPASMAGAIAADEKSGWRAFALGFVTAL